MRHLQPAIWPDFVLERSNRSPSSMPRAASKFVRVRVREARDGLGLVPWVRPSDPPMAVLCARGAGRREHQHLLQLRIFVGHKRQGWLVRHPTVAAGAAIAASPSAGAASTAGAAVLTAVCAIPAALCTRSSPAVPARAHQCPPLLRASRRQPPVRNGQRRVPAIRLIAGGDARVRLHARRDVRLRAPSAMPYSARRVCRLLLGKGSPSRQDLCRTGLPRPGCLPPVLYFLSSHRRRRLLSLTALAAAISTSAAKAAAKTAKPSTAATVTAATLAAISAAASAALGSARLP